MPTRNEAIAVNTLEWLHPCIGSLYCDWDEVAAINGALEDEEAFEIVFKSGTKTIIHLKQTAWVGSLSSLLSVSLKHHSEQHLPPLLRNALK